MSVLSENLYYIRIIHKLSIREAATKLNISPNTLSNWEKGKISPPADSLIDICDLYRIDANKLLGYEPCDEIEEFRNKNYNVLMKLDHLRQERDEIDKEIKRLNDILALGN